MPISINENGAIKSISDNIFLEGMYIEAIDELGYDHYDQGNRVVHRRLCQNKESNFGTNERFANVWMPRRSTLYSLGFSSSSAAKADRDSYAPLYSKKYDYILIIPYYNKAHFHAAENVVAKGTNYSGTNVESNNTIMIYPGQTYFLIPTPTLSNTRTDSTTTVSGGTRKEYVNYERHPFIVATVLKQDSSTTLTYLGVVDGYAECYSKYTTQLGGDTYYDWEEGIVLYWGISSYLKNKMSMSTDSYFGHNYTLIYGGIIKDVKAYGIKLKPAPNGTYPQNSSSDATITS